MKKTRLACILRRSTLPLVLAIALPCATARAASRADVTVVPMGSGAIAQGQSTQSFRIPTDIHGPLPQALVLVAAQPLAMAVPAAPLANAPESEEEKREPVPATVKMTIAGSELPEWKLYRFPSAYVISPATLAANPQYGSGRVEIVFEVNTVAEAVNLTAYGMPDPLLLGDSLDGPITAYLEAATDRQVRQFFSAMANEMAGNKELARSAYHELANSDNAQLARLARRGVRMLSYDERPHKLSGNFREHYRWGLFLSQAGVFSPAFKEFNECRIIYPQHADAQYRCGEMLDHIEGDLFKVQDYMDRAAAAAWERNPAGWSILLVIVKGEGEEKLSASRLIDLKAAWIIAKDMIRGATDAKVNPHAAVYELDSGTSFPLVEYPGGLTGPAPDIVAQRGWFDGVFYLRPRRPGDSGPPVRTIGGDAGPNGAALSTLYTDATWQEFILAWYEQFTWAARNGGLTDGIPMPGEVADCGQGPVPDVGYAIRAALKYHWPPEVLPWVKMVPRPGAREFVRLWEIEGASGGPERQAIESRGDWVDFGKGASAGMTARCWVYSPEDQHVGVWLGGAARVGVNRRIVHRSTGNARADQMTSPAAFVAPLNEGWNEIEVEPAGATNPDGRWGFSLRICGVDDRPVTGLAYVNVKPEDDLAPAYQAPEAGKHYAWRDVHRDWGASLPVLSVDDLRGITGVGGLTLSGEAGEKGHVYVGGVQSAAGARVRDMQNAWRPGEDSDVELNNVLDWDREDCLAVRYTRDGSQRDLLFVRPEGLMAYMTLLNEPASAGQVFGGLPPEKRLLGSVLVPTKKSSRRLFVIDGLLGADGNWPVDEEDLLQPIADEYIPNPPRMGPFPRQETEAQ